MWMITKGDDGTAINLSECYEMYIHCATGIHGFEVMAQLNKDARYEHPRCIGSFKTVDEAKEYLAQIVYALNDEENAREAKIAIASFVQRLCRIDDTLKNLSDKILCVELDDNLDVCDAEKELALQKAAKAEPIDGGIVSKP